MSSGEEGLEDNDSTSTADDLMTSQIAYYRAHTPGYDDWWFRERHHDLGEDFRRNWASEVSATQTALFALAPFDDVLEFAGGTGNWTVELAPLATTVTVVDSSPETAAIARGKVAARNTTWTTADIFDYRPDRQYDTVFFSFWLSHVPAGLFDRFWALVAECLAPGGRVIFIDNAHPSLANNVPEFFPLRSDLPGTAIAGVDGVTDLTTGVSTRLAADGSTYDLVKIWRTPVELEIRLKALGWTFQVAETGWAFIFGHGTRTDGASGSESPQGGAARST